MDHHKQKYIGKEVIRMTMVTLTNDGYWKQKTPSLNGVLEWCGAGSNRRHKDFQSFALPTELPHLLKQIITCVLIYSGQQK
jgi:hypothetical protein